MNMLLGVSGLIFVSAVTPGPNNIAVLRIAGEQGLKATAAAILAVVLGSLALLIVTQAGLDFVAARHECAAVSNQPIDPHTKAIYRTWIATLEPHPFSHPYYWAGFQSFGAR